MKILLIHPHDIYSLQEPWTIRIVSIAKELKKFGQDVKLIYFPLNWQEDTTPSEFEKIPVIPLSRRVGPIILLRNIAKVYRIAEWTDIIHFQKCFHWASIPALFTAFLRKKPIHYDWDDWEEKIFIASNKKPFLPIVIFIRLLERYIPKLVDTISVSSDRLKQLCIDLGVKKERIFLAPVGADLDKFNPQISGDGIKKRYGLDGLLVFYHGQLHGAQYARLFIEAAKQIQEEYPEVNFMLVGDGGKLEELKTYAQRLNLRNFIFTGAVSHRDIPQYIACADICVAPFEDNDITRCKSPLKVVEYLASGKPIVASDISEVNTMVSDAGILVKPGDVQSLTEGIATLLNDKELREKMAKLAWKRAEEVYNWPLTAKNIQEAYKKAIYINKNKEQY